LLKKEEAMKRSCALLLFLALAPALRAQEPAKPWKETAQLTLLNANGNTKSSTLGFDNAFSWTGARWGAEQTAGALNTKSNGQRTAEQYNAGEKVHYKLSDRNYVFEKYRWDRDTLAGFAHRHDASVGGGRAWVQTGKDDLLGEIGAGYLNERLVRGGRNEFVSGRAFAKYSRALSETASFSQNAEYLHNFEHGRDYRLTTQTALSASLSEHFSLKLSYEWKLRNRPPAGFAKSDTLTSVAVIVNY
jgi:putative salt-induced outer membrane protein